MKVFWFKKAQNDLNEIYGFYLFKSAKTAVKIYNSIVNESERLAKHPNIAPIEPLLEGKNAKYIFRSLVTKDKLFKIVYFCSNDIIFIARIWCNRKNPKNFSL